MEKLSPPTNGGGEPHGEPEEKNPAPAAAPPEQNKTAENFSYARSLLERHERSVNKIRSGKK